MLTLVPSVWPATLEHFRHCGQGRVECVVYWVARQGESSVIDEVVHPDHVSTAWMYEVKPAWLNAFMVGLHARGRTVRAQVHTHCEEAFHSQTDDRWPLVTTPGFLSLVLPRFALADAPRDQLFLAELTGDGSWTSVSVGERIEGIP